MCQERDELIEKNKELVTDINDIDRIQKDEINKFEKRVESTIVELKSIRSENQILEKEAVNLKLQNDSLIDKNLELKRKYKNKKVENGHLKERCMKLVNEIMRLETLNQDALTYFNQKENQELQVRRKIKVR